MSVKAVVFAAGYGKRLRPLTLNRPKHVLPIAGKPLISWVVEALGEAGVNEVGVLVGYQGEYVKQALQNFKTIETVFITQQKILGTGAALLECREYLRDEDSFVVVYGDVTVNRDVLVSLRKFWEEGGFDGAMVAVSVDDASRFGVVNIRDNLLVRIGEKEKTTGAVNTGIYILGKKVFEALEETGVSPRGEIELTDALNKLVLRGARIGVKLMEKGWWYDVGNPADYLLANFAYLSKHFGQSVHISQHAELGNRAVFKGPAYVGERCVIGDDCVLIGPVMICGGTVVKAKSEISRSVVLENCFVGEKSVLRDSVVCEDGFFGSGVEVASNSFPAFVSEPGFRSEQRLKIV